MRQTPSEQEAFPSGTSEQVSLQLLLFVDERPSSQDHIQRILNYLQSLKANYPFDLQVIEISEQPHLVEHFRLVATPALIKIAPEPRQTLAGTDIVAQLQKWWSRWQTTVEKEKQNFNSGNSSGEHTSFNSLNYSAEKMLLGDEIFRLKQENEKLREQLQFKEQVLAMLAHDLRSPLTAASIAVETLELAQNQPQSERTETLRGQLYKQAKSQFQIMNRMITDLLQASKNVSAKLQIYPRQLSLQSLCREILPNFQSRLDDKLQILEQDIPQDLPIVYADEELIRQVIVNLLDNAIKYTPIGGKITISMLHRTTQKVQVSICDTGPGIPEEKRDRIFDGHFRLKRDEKIEGYGLGLSLCRKIICAHYGQIWVDSVADHGSCFQFTLPVYL